MADVSVRPARPDDVPEIARIQLLTWRTAYARIVPAAVLESVNDAHAREQWSAAVQHPPSPRHRVLVAVEGASPVGFAALTPAEDDDLDTAVTDEVAALLVEPRWGRRGHGSRLLAAAVDTARDAGVSSLVTWVFAADAASQDFYESAGWAADGARRELDMGGELVTEVRLHTSLEDAP